MRLKWTAGLAVSIGLLLASPAFATGGSDDRIEAEARATGGGSGGGGGEPSPPPECWWEYLSGGSSRIPRYQTLWRQLDGGEHYPDVLFFMENGRLHQTWLPRQTTYVRQVRVCTDPGHADHGRERWEVVGPPDPTVFWPDLTRRVVETVPAPEWDVGFGSDGGPVDVFVNVGLWIAVSNSDDVVAHAEPVPGIWAETRATLDHIEFDPANGDAVVVCTGAGTPLPPDRADDPAEGPCGYTYTVVDDLGERTGTVRAIWRVENTTSSGAYERRPDIVLESPVPMHVREVQTVGGPSD